MMGEFDRKNFSNGFYCLILEKNLSDIAAKENNQYLLDSDTEIKEAISIFYLYKNRLSPSEQNDILKKWNLSDTQQIYMKKNKAVRLAIADSKKNIKEVTPNDSTEIAKYKFGKHNDAPYCSWGVNWFCTRGQGINQNLFGLSDREVGSSQALKREAKDKKCFRKPDKYMPSPGDIIVYTNKSKPQFGHVGLVVAVYSDGSFDTVDPNSHETVERIHYNSIADAKYPKGADGRQTSELAGFIDMEDYYRKFANDNKK